MLTTSVRLLASISIASNCSMQDASILQAGQPCMCIQRSIGRCAHLDTQAGGHARRSCHQVSLAALWACSRRVYALQRLPAPLQPELIEKRSLCACSRRSLFTARWKSV